MLTLPASTDLRERARRATLAGNKMLPAWAAFARMLSRKPDLKVKLTGGTPRTDGETVWLRTPIELGDDLKHEKSLCRKRGEDSRMLCPACLVEDGANTTIFHEMAHILHGSFEEVSESEKAKLVRDAIDAECGGSDEGTRAAKIIKRIETNSHLVSNWMTAASLVSPFLPMLLNAIEDVWVNAEMMEARPGTRVMFQAQRNQVFENGVEGIDGEVVMWKDRPANAQAIIGVYCMGSGLDFSSWLNPEVVEDLTGSGEVKLLCAQIGSARSAKARYVLAIRMLEALRSLGYLLSEEDPEDDEESVEVGDEGESEGEGEGESSEGSEDSDSDESPEGSEDSDSDESPEGSEDSDSDEDPEGEGSGSDDGDGDDDAYDEPDSSSGEGSDNDDHEEGADGEGESGDEESDGMGDAGDDSGSEASPGTPGPGEGADSEPAGLPKGDPEEVEELFKIFGGHDEDEEEPSVEEQEELERAAKHAEHFDETSDGLTGLDVYRHDSPTPHRAFSGHPVAPTPETILGPALARLRYVFADNAKGSRERNLKRGKRLDRKVMGRRIPTGDPRIFSRKSAPGKQDYFVVLGLDISGSTRSGRLVDLIKRAALAQAELLNRLRIPFAVYAHSGMYGLEIFEIKAPGEVWSDKQREALGALDSYAANFDGHTLEFYRKRAAEHRASDKLIMYYTDGAMPCENYNEELRVLKENIEICKRERINLVGIGVRNSDPEKYGLDTIRLDEIEDLPRVVEGLAKRLA